MGCNRRVLRETGNDRKRNIINRNTTGILLLVRCPFLYDVSYSQVLENIGIVDQHISDELAVLLTKIDFCMECDIITN